MKYAIDEKAGVMWIEDEGLFYKFNCLNVRFPSDFLYEDMRTYNDRYCALPLSEFKEIE